MLNETSIPEQIKLYTDYLRTIQGVEIEEDPTGFRYGSQGWNIDVVNAIVGLEAVVDESVPPVVLHTYDVASEELLVNCIVEPAHIVVLDVLNIETGGVEGIT